MHRLINRTADTESDAEMLQLIADTRILPYARSYQLQFGALYHEIFMTNKNVDIKKLVKEMNDDFQYSLRKVKNNREPARLSAFLVFMVSHELALVSAYRI